MSEEPFVPSGFVVPLALTTEQFRLEPLGPQHNDSDYEAWSSSRDHIHATPGWEQSKWPDDRSKEDNLRDLERHADDFEKRAGFTYTVLDPATDDVIGCVYIYPEKTGEHDARVSSWVRASRAELDVDLWRSVRDWLTDEWPFERPYYAERVSSRARVESFWAAMQDNDWTRAAGHFTQACVIDWPCSGERIVGREDFAAIQASYPTNTGRWSFDVHRIVAEGNVAVSEVTVTDGEQAARVVAFSVFQGSQIAHQIEYWPTAYDPRPGRESLTQPIPRVP